MNFRQLIKDKVFYRNEKKKTKNDLVVPEPASDEKNSDYYLDILRKTKDRNKVWAFYAGQASDDFRGNPKYLFIYIYNYRKDITAYWMCQSEETLEFVRNLGYLAFLEDTTEGQEAMDYTGVIVAEQAKNSIPRGFKDVKYLNLYHGIGGKQVERVLTDGLLAIPLAKKYIVNNSFYRDNQLFLATSPITRKNFATMCGIDSDKFVLGGYPRCLYQKYYKRVETFSHDILGEKGLPSDTKIAVYAPTFRKDSKDNVFTTAFPDLDRLVEVCRNYGYMMVFKMHPIMENDPQYLLAKEAYKDCPYLYFWDNKNDFYEMIDRIDLGIIDYSSIFTDMLDAGITHFLRYIYDFEDYKDNLTDPYDEITAGIKCMSYEDLLENMKSYDRTEVSSEKLEPIQKRFWEYSGKDTFENIINRTLEFVPEKRQRKSLYSFDIFDTLFSRKVLDPIGIFFYVKDKMKRSDINFPAYLIDRYPEIRSNCEHNIREFYAKTQKQRNDLRKEIQFDEIFDRMKDLYDLEDQQIDMLKKWELEAELENVIPISENVERCLDLLHAEEAVFLISDMYLPKSFIRKMLGKVSEELLKIPLYLSSDCGWQKTTGMLFMEVYKHFGPDYDFGSWIHTGDNVFADEKMPKKLGIQTIHVEKPEFDEYEQKLVDSIGTYDAYLIAGNMARFRLTHDIKREQFAYEYVSLYMVPYVDWAIHKAVERGDECVYFISRDGHHLKKIADVIIEVEKLPIKTKYIYASRRTWRVPSFIHEIDEEYWDTFGNFGGVNSFKKLLAALGMNEEQFRDMFPEMQNITKDTEITKELVIELTESFRQSQRYRDFVMKIAAEKRVSVCGYLEQEINPDEQFSIIEYWGRGYTQDCFVNLWHHITGRNDDIPFYYARSILPSQGSSIRYNFTSNHTSQIFVEAIFANINYKSIVSYHMEDGIYKPDIEKITCDEEFLKAMETHLCGFTRDYIESSFIDRVSLRKELFDFSLNYYADNPTNPLFLSIVAPLIDSVTLYGVKQEFAKPFTMKDLEDFANGFPRLRKTRNIKMSVARSNALVREKYMELYQVQNDDEVHRNAVLKPQDLEESKKLQLQYEKLESLSNEIGEAYDRYSDHKMVPNMVLFCARGSIPENTSFRKIYRILKQDESIKVEEIDFSEKQLDIKMAAEKMAKAPVIIITQSLGELSKIRFRKETKVIHLGEVAFNYFMHDGFRLKNKQKLSDLNYSVQITTMQVPSEKMIPVLKKHHNLDGSVDFTLKGCCQTDVYYDEDEKKAALEKLAELLPETVGKKIIFYMPHARYRSKIADYYETINMKLLRENLKDDYFVIMHLPGRLRNNKNLNLEIPGFSADLTNKMFLREQLMAADIIIGDYRDSIFEATLTKKPIFITSSDKDSIKKNPSYFDYDDVVPGVEVESDYDLIDKILHVQSYDDSNSKRFREKYLSYCDGKSADRLYEYIKSYLSTTLCS